MNFTPLLKFCLLSLMLHVALAVHVLSVGVLDASQTSTTLEIMTVDGINSVNLPNSLSATERIKKSVLKTFSRTNSNKIPIEKVDSDQMGAETPTVSGAGVTGAVASDVATTTDLPKPADGSLITQGLRPLNLTETNKSIKRTQEAIEKNIEGQIKLKLLVDETGTVKQVTAMNSLGYGLDKVAIDAAWKLRFIAAKIKSQNVALETYYTVKFTITHQ